MVIYESINGNCSNPCKALADYWIPTLDNQQTDRCFRHLIIGNILPNAILKDLRNSSNKSTELMKWSILTRGMKNILTNRIIRNIYIAPICKQYGAGHLVTTTFALTQDIQSSHNLSFLRLMQN